MGWETFCPTRDNYSDWSKRFEGQEVLISKQIAIKKPRSYKSRFSVFKLIKNFTPNPNKDLKFLLIH